MTPKCNANFQSQYAYINNQPIHINDYKKDKKDNLLCCHGHQLTAVKKASFRKAHFRHKNLSDVIDKKMSEWHSAWQDEFEVTEHIIFKIDNQIKERHADAYINSHNMAIEFQHSQISKEEVDNRKHDYNLHNVNIIWIIDGNRYVEKIELSNGRIFFTFNAIWLYDSFTSYDIVYIDHEDNLYKLYPKYVKSKMIDVEKPYDKINFIQMIKENNQTLYDVSIPPQCNLYIKQQGAGNGKTYGLIQMLESDEFEHCKHFIVVTKQHSAKYIIYQEFLSQINNNNLQHLTNVQEYTMNKKYRLSYFNNKNESTCNMVICTIDSLMYNLGNNQINCLNKFKGIIESIIDGYIETNHINSLICGNINIILNKEICLIIDETQDLSFEYSKAIIQLMRSRYIDAYIVGDKLQSITYENNAFTFFDDDMPYINKICFKKTNICRRFQNDELTTFCNSIINFNKYELPQIIPYEIDYSNDNLILIEGKDYKKDNECYNEEVNKIMYYYKYEIENNKCEPNDFLFVTPFTTKNSFVNSIEIAINNYWNMRLNTITYTRYAIFHKSEEGTSINLDLSKDATRIVSIHSSKGDGRKIVFVIGLDENSLKRFSKGSINLVYESLLHVAITRMKLKLYFRYIPKYDDIHNRLFKYGNSNKFNIVPIIYQTNNIKYNYIIDENKNDDIFDELTTKIISKCNIDKYVNNSDDKHNIIDISHHNIRYMCMKISIMLEIIKKNEGIKKQIPAIFLKIKNANITPCSDWKEYNNLLHDNSNNRKEHIKKNICVLQFHDKPSEYKTYYNVIIKTINNVRKKFNDILNQKEVYLCPYESIILYYMYDICDNGIFCDFTITELYDITNIYQKTFSHNLPEHTKCNCKLDFNNNINVNNNLYKYLLEHHEKMSILKNTFKIFLINHPNITWLFHHYVEYNGKNNNYNINKRIDIIGYDNNNVYNVYLYPTFNALNYNQIILTSIYDTFLLQSDITDNNLSETTNNITRFNNKNINTIIFSTDNKQYYTFKWFNDDNNFIKINNKYFITQLQKYMKDKYYSEIMNYYNFFEYHYSKSDKATILEKIKDVIQLYNDFKGKKETENTKLPHFIDEFFANIRSKINEHKRNQSEQNNIISQYLNLEFFKEKIEDMINDSIDDYLGCIDETNYDNT